jgi:hypothetical protein
MIIYALQICIAVSVLCFSLSLPRIDITREISAPFNLPVNAALIAHMICFGLIPSNDFLKASS